MKTRLFLAALCIFLLPLCFGQSNSASSQFSAYASGYLIATGLEPIPCECDPALEGYHPDCICDGGDSTAVNPESTAASDLGSESLLILAALMLWLRLKA
jgi:hypothetical protein